MTARPIDFTVPRTKRQRDNAFAGHGGLYNNHYAGIALSPSGKPTLYLGGIGGIVALREG